MKLSEIIARLDKSEKNSDWVDIESIASKEFNINDYPSEENTLLKCYWIANHFCSDTYVGIRAYFLDDTFVAVSFQSARKSPEIFDWASDELFIKTRDYLRSLFGEDALVYTLADLDSDFGDHYPIQYAGQFIKREVLLDDVPVRIIGEVTHLSKYKGPNVKVRLPDGEEKWVFPSDLKTPFNLISLDTLSQ